MSASDQPDAYVSVVFSLHSKELTPQMISERLGLQPTSTHLKGTPIIDDPAVWKEISPTDPPRIIRTCHSFIFEISRRCTGSSHGAVGKLFDALLDELLQKVEPVADRLDQLREHVSARLMCIYGTQHKPKEFKLSQALIQRLAALGLSFTVFFASLEEEKPQDDDG